MATSDQIDYTNPGANDYNFTGAPSGSTPKITAPDNSAPFDPTSIFPTTPSAPGTPIPTSGNAYRQWLGQQYNTPADIVNNYWAPDWKTVFTTPSRWGANAPGAAGAATTSPFNIDTWGQGWVNSGGRTNQDFANYVTANPLGAGYALSGTHNDKVTGPNGTGWDMVIGSGLGGNGASFSPFGGPGGGASAAPPAGSEFGDPLYQQLSQLLSAHEAAAPQRAQALADELNTRAKALQAPLLTDAQVANQRAAMMNNIEASRDASLKNAQESLYARGFAPTSGLAEGSNRSIAEDYTNRESQADAALTRAMITTDEGRRNQATQLQTLAQQALEGGDLSAIQSASTGVGLSNTGLYNAMQVLGSGGSPNSGLASILSLLGPAAGQQGVNLGINASNMGGLASIIQLLLGS